MKVSKRDKHFLLLLASLMALVLFIYWPGISGPLVLDDYPNLSRLGENGAVNSWDRVISFVFGNSSGPSGRPVAMLSFLIDGQSWPPNIASFKYTNILIHLLNGILLCWVLTILFSYLDASRKDSVYLALIVSAIWLLHPLNSTTTLYVVQRMTQLMMLFALISIGFYLKGRIAINVQPRKAAVLLCVAMFPFALLSVLSKENGALLLLLIVIFEVSFFREAKRNRFFNFWYTAAVLFPFLLVIVYLLMSVSANVEAYDFRHFGLLERLLTESRILVLYLSKIFLPLFMNSGLFHDDILVSSSLVQPLTTLFSVGFLSVLLYAGLFFRKSQPMLFFGIAWFFALHLLESTYIPLELYFEHRNYMAMVGPWIAAIWYLYGFATRGIDESRISQVGIALSVFIVFLGWQTWQQSKLWGHTGDLMASWAYENPQSSRAQLAFGDFLLRNEAIDPGMEYLEAAHQLKPNEITILLHQWNRACEHGTNAPYSIEEIVLMPNLEYYQNDINFHLRELIEHVRGGRCDIPSLAVLSSLFEKVLLLPLAADREVNVHLLYSDLFVHFRRLNPALIELRKAFDLAPTVADIPIRQATLSASAGNYNDALVFLQRAHETDSKRGLFTASKLQEITQLEEQFRRQL